MFECFLHRLSKINWEYRWSSTCFPSLKTLLAQMSDYFACCHLCLFVPESDIKKFWDFYLFRRANSISDTFFFHRAGLSRLFSGKCVAAGPDFWVALSPANVWALPIRQIYSTWTDTPSGSPPLSRLASFESGRGGSCYCLPIFIREENLLFKFIRDLFYYLKVRRIVRTCDGEIVWKQRGECWEDLLKFVFSVCQSILKRYYWHRLVQYLWARCERSERYLALRDFSNPAGTSNRG